MLLVGRFADRSAAAGRGDLLRIGLGAQRDLNGLVFLIAPDFEGDFGAVRQVGDLAAELILAVHFFAIEGKNDVAVHQLVRGRRIRKHARDEDAGITRIVKALENLGFDVGEIADLNTQPAADD